MPPSLVHLPNGQTLHVSPSFGGLYFKSNELNTHHTVFPAGWTIILNSEDDQDGDRPKYAEGALPDPDPTPQGAGLPANKRHVHRFRKPSLKNDHLFISSISNPSSSDFRPPISPTRQIAMMLWATLWWYFHQPEPAPQLATTACASTADAGKPKGEWRISINREGIFKGKHLLPKLERMGLIASEDSSVGVDPDDGVHNVSDGWTKMFVSRRTFWQLDARIYLFTLSPLTSASPFPSLSPANSRPASPNRNSTTRAEDGASTPTLLQATTAQMALNSRGANTPPNPFSSSSHLPTFYPPPPLQYTFTNHVRHPIRPKPPRQGEIFYVRYVPSLGQYLSFRVASLSKQPVAHRAPTSQNAMDPALPSAREILRMGSSNSDPGVPTFRSLNADADSEAATPLDTTDMTDVQLLHKWMNDPRVSHSWGEQGPQAHQEEFLKHGVTSRHSVPVIGCFDGKPFGYFEIYWAKEDRISMHLDACGDWDRGVHVLVGEQEFRGPHRVKVWLSALVHYCWLADSRSQMVVMEPRVDNVKLRTYAEDVGFFKEREVSFPHKQSNLLKIRREAWESPAL